MELTQDYLKSIFNYDNGRLYWKVKPNRSIALNSLVGCIYKREGYPRYYTKINYKAYLCSRLVFLFHKGYLPEVVDHEDRNTLNDRIENLRDATHSQNSINKKKTKNRTSIYIGVSLIVGKYWRASIRINQKPFIIGHFKSEQVAAMEFNKYAVRYHKEFANLNIIQP